MLKPRCTHGSSVTQTVDGWRLDIPAGMHGTYRLAQLDDYVILSRRLFQHIPPWTLSLEAKVSARDLPGTWGFGLWNDPFGFSLGFGRTEGRLPVLPNATWFFYASPPNWLSFREGIPAHGFFAGTINSPRVPSVILSPALLAIPFLTVRPISRLFRRLAGKTILQDATEVSVDVTKYHNYSIAWLRESVLFKIDGESILKTSVSPHHPLGMVFWIDNQFAAWNPEGRLGYGTLDNPAASLEINSIEMNL